MQMGVGNAMSDPILLKVHTEQTQGHETRRKLFDQLASDLDRPMITFFTSFRYPVAMADEDVQALEDLLRTLDLSKGIAIMISSPGGSGLAAERMINVLRSYNNIQPTGYAIGGKSD